MAKTASKAGIGLSSRSRWLRNREGSQGVEGGEQGGKVAGVTSLGLGSSVQSRGTVYVAGSTGAGEAKCC